MMWIARTLPALAFAALCGIPVAGCAIVTTRVSHSAAMPEAGSPRLRDGLAAARLPQVDVEVEAQDAVGTWSVVLPLPLPLPWPHPGGGKRPDRLPLWIELVARDGGEVVLDPSALRIIDAAGDTLRALDAAGPGLGSRAWLSPYTCRCGEPGRIPAKLAGTWRKRFEPELDYRLCYDCDTARGVRAPSPHAARSPACWLVEFPHPGSRFTLLLDGIACDGAPQPGAECRFVHGMRWKMIGWAWMYL